MKNELVKIEKPELPKNWDYEKSVKKTKARIYKWKKLTKEILVELFIAREKLRSKGGRKSIYDKEKNLGNSAQVKSWEGYCNAIGVSKRTVNDWLSRAFGEEKLPTLLNPPILPKGKFDIICADPPWQYEHPISNSRRIENQYPTLSVEEISNYVDSKGKSILDIFADNAILFLWATNPKLMEAIMVLYSWGFEYRTNFVWIKDKMGMGYFCRGQHELLLIAKRGEYPAPEDSNKPISIIEAPRLEHSEKPEEAYKIIEKMYPKGKKVELFGRKKREGWELFGQEN